MYINWYQYHREYFIIILWYNSVSSTLKVNDQTKPACGNKYNSRYHAVVTRCKETEKKLIYKAYSRKYLYG